MERQEKHSLTVNYTDLCDYLSDRLVLPYLPKVEEDWNLFGSVISRTYGPDGVFPKQYSDKELLKWIQHKIQVRNLLLFVQRKLFTHLAMLHNTRATDAVQMRIFVSMLNKLGLPRIYADEIFDNVHLQYDIRKPVFEDYYLMKILGLPFVLNLGLVLFKMLGVRLP